MDDEQIKALFDRKRELEHKLITFVLDPNVAWLDQKSEVSQVMIADFTEELILEGWIDLKLPMKFGQVFHPRTSGDTPPFSRGADASQV